METSLNEQMHVKLVGTVSSATARAALPFLTGLLTKHFIPAMPQRGEPMPGARHVANPNKDLTLWL
jgi:hypothetical protein